MPDSPSVELDLRAATLDDVRIVADLEAARDPEDPRDPKMLRHWWTSASSDEVTMRLVAVRQDAAIAFLGVGHRRWDATPARFGWFRPILCEELWSEGTYLNLVRKAEGWLREEGAAIAVARARADRQNELEGLGRAGYREIRRQNISELDLVAHRDRLLEAAAKHRRQMQDQGVEMLTLSGDKDPDRMAKLYEMMIAAEQDIPTTVPIPQQPFDEWKGATFDNPGTREDRFWIAREGGRIVGLSFLDFPPTRGLPWTNFTATSNEVRGRGIARALKYESIAQAIDLGHERIRTSNDGANAPILHINEEMGYRLVVALIELHRELSS
ncbi:MAG TPA: GNAT family N-acetyltransferase [Candidatus Dormibacteraeota bacterium]|nr:GNAT family N-acetyltransferase [Candidatus Dormibacteraeota bacterium]